MKKKIKSRETVGKLASDLLSNPDTKQGVIDTQREMTKGYLQHIHELVTTSECKDWINPFYIEVIQRRERLMANVIRHHFVARQTLPSPSCDQDVWKYYPHTGNLEYLWTVPDINAVEYFINNVFNVKEDQKQLMEFCHHFRDGTLDKVFGK